MATMSHILVAMDATSRDGDLVDVAAQLAATTGVSLAVVLPRTSRVAGRLAAFAAGEDLTLPDAAEAYVERMADRLRDRGVPAVAMAPSADDEATAIAAHASRHQSALVLVTGDARERRRLMRTTTAQRLATLSTTPVLVVPPQRRATDRTAPVGQT